MGGGRPLEAAPESPGARQRKAAGAWVGYLIFGLFLVCLILIDVEAAYQHRWVGVTGITVFTVLYLIVPTGGLKWLRRAMNDRKAAHADAANGVTG